MILILYYQHVYLKDHVHADLFVTIIDIYKLVEKIREIDQAWFSIFHLTLTGENGNGDIAHSNRCWCFHTSVVFIIIYRCRNGACTCVYHNWVDIFHCIRTHHHRLGYKIYKPTCSAWIFLIFGYFCQVRNIRSARYKNKKNIFLEYDEHLIMIVFVF